MIEPTIIADAGRVPDGSFATAFIVGTKYLTMGSCQGSFNPKSKIVFVSAIGADFPSENDVRAGVVYDAGSQTGNMTEPSPADVKIGIQYGANGTEFTGTLVSGGGEKSYSFVD